MKEPNVCALIENLQIESELSPKRTIIHDQHNTFTQSIFDTMSGLAPPGNNERFNARLESAMIMLI